MTNTKLNTPKHCNARLSNSPPHDGIHRPQLIREEHYQTPISDPERPQPSHLESLPPKLRYRQRPINNNTPIISEDSVFRPYQEVLSNSASSSAITSNETIPHKLRLKANLIGHSTHTKNIPSAFKNTSPHSPPIPSNPKISNDQEPSTSGFNLHNITSTRVNRRPSFSTHSHNSSSYNHIANSNNQLEIPNFNPQGSATSTSKSKITPPRRPRLQSYLWGM